MIVILWRNACTHSYPLMLKYCHTRFTCKLHFRPGFAYKSIAYVCPLDTRSTSRFTVNIAGRNYWLHNLVTTKVYFCNVYFYNNWIHNKHEPFCQDFKHIFSNLSKKDSKEVQCHLTQHFQWLYYDFNIVAVVILKCDKTIT